MPIGLTDPVSGAKLNLSIPVEFSGTATNDITTLKIHTPLGTRDYLLGSVPVVEGKWFFPYQFNTAGNRKVVINGLDAANAEVDETVIDFVLEDKSIDVVGQLTLAVPVTGSKLDLESVIQIKGTAASTITRVVVRSSLGGNNYSLGSSSVTSDHWSISYKFSRGGVRKVIADGLDASGNRVATVSTEIKLGSTIFPEEPFEGMGWVGMDKTTQEFRDKVVEIAGRLGVKPLYLMAVMSFETGGTFSARIQNPVSGATGLIQFMPFTAKALGTSVDGLLKMKPVEQLDYVEKYFRPFSGDLNTLEDTYMAVLWPSAVGKGRDAVLFSWDSIEYRQNSGLDVDRDGHVTAREAADLVRTRLIA